MARYSFELPPAAQPTEPEFVARLNDVLRRIQEAVEQLRKGKATGDLDMAGHRVINLGRPRLSGDGVPLDYIQHAVVPAARVPGELAALPQRLSPPTRPTAVEVSVLEVGVDPVTGIPKQRLRVKYYPPANWDADIVSFYLKRGEEPAICEGQHRAGEEENSIDLWVARPAEDVWAVIFVVGWKSEYYLPLDEATALKSEPFLLPAPSAPHALDITDATVGTLTYGKTEDGVWYWGIDRVAFTNPSFAQDPEFYYTRLTVQRTDANGNPAPEYDGVERTVSEYAEAGKLNEFAIDLWTIPPAESSYRKIRLRLYVVNRLGQETLQVMAWSGKAWAEVEPASQTGALAANRLDPAMLHGSLAVALGQLGIAGKGVTTDKLADLAVTAAQLATGAVEMDKLAQAAVTTAKLAGLAVDSTKLADLAVTAAKLATGAVETDKLAQAAVTTAKLAGLAVDSTKLADLAVTAAKLATEAVETDKLAQAAVTTAKLAGLAVDSTKLADLAVTAAKLATGAVETDKLAQAAVTTAKLAGLAVDSTKLADLAVTAAKLATGAVETDKLAQAAVTTAKLAGLAVDSTKLADLAVNAAKLADSAVTAAKIANAAVGSAAIANLAVGTAHIQDAAIVEAKIGSAAVTSAKIANAAVGSAAIANLAVGTAHIQDAAIVEAKIGSAAVTSAKIANAAVGSAAIGNLAVGTAHIASGAVTEAQIGTAAVTSAKIANAAVGSAAIANLAVGTAHIASGAITEAQIGTAAVTSAKIANAAVGSAAIAALAVGNTHIQDAAITNAKIASCSIAKLTAGTATFTGDATFQNTGNLYLYHGGHVFLNPGTLYATTGHFKSAGYGWEIVPGMWPEIRNVWAYGKVKAGYIVAEQQLWQPYYADTGVAWNPVGKVPCYDVNGVYKGWIPVMA